MIGEIIAQRADIERLKSLLGGMVKVGPVAVVDARKGFRIKLGESATGKPYLSPWYPHPESGGATKTWAPLSEGQIVGMINPAGDPRQGVLLRGGFSDENAQPSDSLDENKFVFGGVEITIGAEGSVVINATGKVVVNSPDVHLGGEGGPKIARVGDLVQVGLGSSAGQWPIVSGASNVSAI